MKEPTNGSVRSYFLKSGFRITLSSIHLCAGEGSLLAEADLENCIQIVWKGSKHFATNQIKQWPLYDNHDVSDVSVNSRIYISVYIYIPVMHIYI